MKKTTRNKMIGLIVIPTDFDKALKEHLQDNQHDSIISDLNKVIESSDATCIESG
jgi:hypothetical protein